MFTDWGSSHAQRPKVSAAVVMGLPMDLFFQTLKIMNIIAHS